MPQILRIERGTTLLEVQSLDVSLSQPVADEKKTALFFSNQASNRSDAARLTIAGRLLDLQTLRFEHHDDPGRSTPIEWALVEFDGDVNVQRGFQTLTAASQNVAINPVPLDRTSLNSLGFTGENSAGLGANEAHTRRLDTDSSILFSRYSTTWNITVSWEVITWETGATVERGVINSAGQNIIDINPAAAIANGFGAPHFRTDESPFGGRWHTWAGYLLNSTTYRVQRDIGTSVAQELAWETIGFAQDVASQHGIDVVPQDVMDITVGIASIAVDRSIVGSGFASIYAWSEGNILTNNQTDKSAQLCAARILSSTQFELSRWHMSGNPLDIGWHVLEFAQAIPEISGQGSLDDVPDAITGEGATTAANFASGTLIDADDEMAGNVYVSAHYDGAGTLADLLDSVSGSGIVGAAVAASGSLTDADDTLQGIEIVGHSGQASLDDADDSIAGIGSVISGITASGGLLDASDSASGAIMVRHPAAGSLSDGQDNIAASGGLDFGALGGLADAPDTLVGFGTIPINVPGDGTLTDQADFLRGVGFVQLATDVLGRYFCEEVRETVIHDWGSVVTIGGQQARGVFEWGWDETHDRFVPMLVLESCAHLSLEHGTEVRATLPLIGDKSYWVAGIRPSSGGSTVVMLQEEDPTIPP